MLNTRYLNLCSTDNFDRSDCYWKLFM